MQCLICCEDFNKSNRKKVKCQFCEFDVCRTCASKFILNSTQPAHCMNCKHVWDREILEKHFTKKFCLSDYKEHREKVLFDTQKSMMPDTQRFVEMKIKEKKYISQAQEIATKIRETETLLMEMRHNRPDTFDEEFEIEFEMLNKQVKYYNIDVASINRMKQLIMRSCNEPVKKELKKKLVRSCPAADCKGFLDSHWKCGLCDCNVCKTCHEIKVPDVEHVCLKDNVKTAELLMKDSKPCPSCTSMIFKIEGCDQMYCVMCHTAFSWRTGNIETGIIHNPHFFEIQRKLNGGNIPRQPGDVPCGGVPNAFDLSNHIRRIMAAKNSLMEQNIISVLRLYHHINIVTLPRYRINDEDVIYRDLRVKYMMNELDEENFKKKLQRAEKNLDKRRDIVQVYNTFQSVALETLINIWNTKDVQTIENEYANLVTLREYINECLTKISSRYNNTVSTITETWGGAY